MAFGLEIAGQLTSIKRSEDGTIVLELYAGRLYHLRGCVDVIACTPITPGIESLKEGDTLLVRFNGKRVTTPLSPGIIPEVTKPEVVETDARVMNIRQRKKEFIVTLLPRAGIGTNKASELTLTFGRERFIRFINPASKIKARISNSLC